MSKEETRKMAIYTVVIVIDSWRYDEINDNTPFIASLAENGISGSIVPLAGYGGQVETMFTGLPIHLHNTWANIYKSENPRLKWVSRLSFLDVSPALRSSLSYFCMGLNVISGDSYLLKLYNIPLGLFKYFDYSKKHLFCERKRGFFEMLENKIPYFYYNYPVFFHHSKRHFTPFRYSDAKVLRVLVNNLRKDTYFYYTHIWELDKVGHKHGPHSEIRNERLTLIDSLIEKLCETLKERNYDFNLLLLGDHGMASVENFIDIQGEIGQIGIIPERDYLMFLDSTLARFWFSNEAAKKEVIELLDNIDCMDILTRSDLQQYGIDFPHNRYGDIIAYCKPGTIILPSFYQKTPVKGMHGYMPDCKEMSPAFVLYSSHINCNKVMTIKFEDIFPTLLEIMNFKTNYDINGKSIFR